MITETRSSIDFARRIRRDVLHMVHRANASHVGTCFSMSDILAVLYSGVLRVDSERPDWPERDRLVLSKGHGCAGLYAALAGSGFFPREWLDEYCADDSHLAGHASHHGVPGVEFQRFLMALSVRPGNSLASSAHLLPMLA